MTDLQETVFFLIAQRWLSHEEDFCPLSLNTLRKHLTFYTLDYYHRKAILSAIAALSDSGFIDTREPRAGFAGTRRAFSTLLFQITPLGLDYIDRLVQLTQDQGEDQGGFLWNK